MDLGNGKNRENRRNGLHECFSGIKAVAFDLDGTLYQGREPVAGARELVLALREEGIAVFYLTNDSTNDRETICRKLDDLGFPVEIEAVGSTTWAAARYLARSRYRRVFCCGSDGLRRELELADVPLVEADDHPDVLLLGKSRGFDYDTIATCLNVLKDRSCDLVVCNRDRDCRVGNGRFEPGCGPCVAAVEWATDRVADLVLGKPEPFMLEILARRESLRPGEILVVGDNRESDILLARGFGSPAVWIDWDGLASTEAPVFAEKPGPGLTVVRAIGDLIFAAKTDARRGA